MKHLLILISFLLLSSPVIGDNHKGETLYRWDNPSGDGYVWKGFGDKETHPKYKGDVKKGKPNGLGFLISPDDGKYVGEWKDGELWNGEYYFGGYLYLRYVKGAQHCVDEGELKIVCNLPEDWEPSETGVRNFEGERSGMGTWTHGDGSKYVGEFKNGKRWNGTETDKEGKVIGKWVNGVKHK